MYVTCVEWRVQAESHLHKKEARHSLKTVTDDQSVSLNLTWAERHTKA